MVAMATQHAEPTTAHQLPNMSSSGVLSNMWTSTMPLRMVLATPWPNAIAPLRGCDWQVEPPPETPESKID
jgi:hypothetical protein